MANALQNSARASFLTAGTSWSSHNIKVVLVSASYTYSAAHDNLDDVGAGTRIATSANLASKTTTDGYADSADVTFTSVAGGSTVTGLWVYRDTGTESTSTLLAWYDTDATPAAISVATNGGDIVVSPNASGWFRL